MLIFFRCQFICILIEYDKINLYLLYILIVLPGLSLI